MTSQINNIRQMTIKLTPTSSSPPGIVLDYQTETNPSGWTPWLHDVSELVNVIDDELTDSNNSVCMYFSSFDTATPYGVHFDWSMTQIFLDFQGSKPKGFGCTKALTMAFTTPNTSMAFTAKSKPFTIQSVSGAGQLTVDGSPISNATNYVVAKGSTAKLSLGSGEASITLGPTGPGLAMEVLSNTDTTVTTDGYVSLFITGDDGPYSTGIEDIVLIPTQEDATKSVQFYIVDADGTQLRDPTFTIKRGKTR